MSYAEKTIAVIEQYGPIGGYRYGTTTYYAYFKKTRDEEGSYDSGEELNWVVTRSSASAINEQRKKVVEEFFKTSKSEKKSFINVNIDFGLEE